ncbi:hypothetical protein WT41_14870 [Burkholderia territorii]|uniref:hypothetical protein n=1 Tax=Burkholderia territorii TaxID=1503055 RepID=UPI000755D050|nr:hypothetical protein [Burkholderia territorii]KWA43013.1 hypothetical protein WT41_14870 [Burkholderia territorii]
MLVLWFAERILLRIFMEFGRFVQLHPVGVELVIRHIKAAQPSLGRDDRIEQRRSAIERPVLQGIDRCVLL